MHIEERLESLRGALLVNWRELCEKLDISERTLHYIRISERNPSPKLIRKIVELEHQAGIAPAVSPGAAVREHPGEYRVEKMEKEINKLEAIQEINRIRESLAKLEKLLKGEENE
jgi:transcriptional regulator with XRE-family HTH domain